MLTLKKTSEKMRNICINRLRAFHEPTYFNTFVSYTNICISFMLNFLTLLRPNQIKQSYSWTLAFPNHKTLCWLLKREKPTASLPWALNYPPSATVNLLPLQNLHDKYTTNIPQIYDSIHCQSYISIVSK